MRRFPGQATGETIGNFWGAGVVRADGYDQTVGLSDEENRYPFTGYKEILARIYQIVLAKGKSTILATYSLHHLTDEGKIALIQSLSKLLKKDGMLLIGDVAFADRAVLVRCQKEAGEEWDDDWKNLKDAIKKHNAKKKKSTINNETNTDIMTIINEERK